MYVKETALDNGQRERVIGYLGERSTERFFLLKGINARVCEFEAFDVLVIDKDGSTYKCQVKTTTKDRFSVVSGRNRKGSYTKKDADFYALVKLEDDGRDTIWFLTTEEVTARSIAIAKLKDTQMGTQGWNRVRKAME